MVSGFLCSVAYHHALATPPLIIFVVKGKATKRPPTCSLDPIKYLPIATGEADANATMSSMILQFLQLSEWLEALTTGCGPEKRKPREG
jgi:hypothetical protein